MQPLSGGFREDFACVFSSPAVREVSLLRFQQRFGGFLACKSAPRLVFLLHIREDDTWASSHAFREVFWRLFHCCFGVFSLLCGLFQGWTALKTLCFCPTHPLLRLSLPYPLFWVPSLPEDTFSRRFSCPFPHLQSFLFEPSHLYSLSSWLPRLYRSFPTPPSWMEPTFRSGR